MPSQVRIIRQPNSKQWDELVLDVLNRGAFGQEHDYYGIADNARADSIRRHIRTAAKHQGVGAKVFWKACPNPGKCANGGSDCQFHVYYTCYDLEVAKAYKAQQAEQAARSRR